MGNTPGRQHNGIVSFEFYHFLGIDLDTFDQGPLYFEDCNIRCMGNALFGKPASGQKKILKGAEAGP